jgi:serine/threonine protein kinase
MSYIKTGYTDNGSEWEVGHRWLLEGVCCCLVLDICPAFSQISDFGLSKWMEQSTQKQYIERSALRGTLSYIPPEMFLENNKAPGPEYDVYR